MIAPPTTLSLKGTEAAGLTGVLGWLGAVSQGFIEVAPLLYEILSVTLGLAGVYLARLVTIGDENRRLGREQTGRETGPLTWVAILIVGPAIWHYSMPIPYASIFGLGVGYSVKVVLKIVGTGTVAAARAIAQRVVESLADTPTPRKPMDDEQRLIDRIDEID